jgi:hypothetical protein
MQVLACSTHPTRERDYMSEDSRAADPHDSTPQAGFTRRTLVKGAAWSAPVIALAVAAPAAAASNALPPATFAYTGGSLGVRSGNVAVFNLNGIDSEGAPAALPSGSAVTVSPSPGITFVVVSSSGATMVDNGDGSFTFVVTATDVSAVLIRVRPTGPVGDGIDFDTALSIEPFTESFNIPIIP